MLQRELDDLIDVQIYFVNRSIGPAHPRKIKAINIAPDLDDTPEWRVSEGELVRWFKLMGFKIYERGKII